MHSTCNVAYFLPCVLIFLWTCVIRSHTVSTQLVTFKMLVAIITRYPGIRRLFYHPKDCGQVLSTFKEDWIRAHHNCGEGWNFYMNYTLHCLSDSELTALVEKELPSQLGRLELPEDDWNKVPIEELLSFCRSVPNFTCGCTWFAYLALFQAQSQSLTHIPSSVLFVISPAYWNYRLFGKKELTFGGDFMISSLFYAIQFPS